VRKKTLTYYFFTYLGVAVFLFSIYFVQKEQIVEIYTSNPPYILIPPYKPIKEQSINSVITQAKNLENKKTYINFPHKSILVTYKDLGVSINVNAIKNYYKECSTKKVNCTTDINKLIYMPDTNIIQIDQNMLNKYIDMLNTESKTLLEYPKISFDTLSFSAYDKSAKIGINKVKLISQLNAVNIVNSDYIKIETEITSKNSENEIQETKQLMLKATKNALLIKYGRMPIYISPNDLENFIAIDTNSEAKIQKHKIQKYLETLKNKYKLDIQLEDKEAILSIAHALLFRVNDESPNTAVILPIKGVSKTNGEYTNNKYLEVNKTQQRMYAFKNGKLVNTYIIGTGLTWETPAGNFKVLKKSGTAISYTGNWFMPYYMPIGTVNGLFFGFHEIPYQINAQGNITSRNPNTMGSPATGGCIQLYNKDAIKLYKWAEVGTPVIILE